MTNAIEPDTQPTDDASPLTAPLVFISHDGRDATIAEAFSKLLANVTAGAAQRRDATATIPGVI